MGDGLQVGGIDARPDSAQMVDRQAFGDRADEQLVGDSVSESMGCPPAVGSALSVARAVLLAQPDPASCGSVRAIDEIEQPFDWRSVAAAHRAVSLHAAMSQQPGVVSAAVAGMS